MIVLRNISVNDSALLAKIHQQSFTEAWSKNTFQCMLMDSCFFGFLIGQESRKLSENDPKKLNKIECGFILARKVLDEIEIITFCVLPEYRRKNFGKLLMVELIKQAGIFLQKEFEHNDTENMKIFLEVAEDNLAATNLYTSFGFKKISHRSKYYKKKDGKRVDANIMAFVVTVSED